MKKALFLVLSYLCIANLNAQDTIKVYYPNLQLKECYWGQIRGNDTLRLGFYEYYINGILNQKTTYYNNKLQGLFEVFYEDERLKISYNYDDGLRNGIYRYYDQFGNLRQIGNYKNDELDGLLKLVKFNGQYEATVEYKNGLKNGFDIQYDPKSGKVSSKIEYKNDSINGLYETFYDDGNLNYRGKRIGDNFQDELVVFYPSGDTLRKCFYKNGIIVGDLISYYEHGIVRSITPYQNGMMNGEFMEYFSDGTTAQKGQYKFNRKVGEWIAYYPEGDLFSIGKFKDSKYEGRWKIFYENGIVKQDGCYHDGKAIGEWAYYYYSGNVWKRGCYVDDKQEGLWLFYDENGDHVNSVYFEHGLMHPIAQFKSQGEWEKVYIKNGEVFPIFPKEEDSQQ